jgi:hypothetical protein
MEAEGDPSNGSIGLDLAQHSLTGCQQKLSDLILEVATLVHQTSGDSRTESESEHGPSVSNPCDYHPVIKDGVTFCPDPDCGVAMMDASNRNMSWCPRCGMTVTGQRKDREPAQEATEDPQATQDTASGVTFCVCGGAMLEAVHGGLECPLCGRKQNRVSHHIEDRRVAPGS